VQKILTRLLVAWLLLLVGGSAVAAAKPTPLKLNGQPVGFAFWGPEQRVYSYDDVALAAERRALFEEEGVEYLYGLYRVELHFRADGDVEEHELAVRHLLSRAAVNNHGNDEHWVDAFAETATIEQAYVLLPDGERVETDPNTLLVKADNDDDIFTDNFEIVVPFAGLRPGAATVLAVRTRHKSDSYPLPFSRTFMPQVMIPIERFEMRMTWDEGVTPPAWNTDFEKLDCRNTEPRQVDCQAEQIEPHPKDPDIVYSDTLPTLVVGEATTWPALARRMSSLVQTAYSEKQELKRDLEKLLEGATSPQERLARIHGFVSQEIRYLGLEHGLGGIIPRPTRLTFSRRFGDCKDKTTLFVDLARRAGFDAYPVLTSSNRKNLEKLLIPAAGYFDHMVACVRLPGVNGGEGRELCFDLTDPYSSSDTLSDWVQGAVRLKLTEATTAPDRLPGDRFTWALEVRTDFQLNADGSLDQKRTRRYGRANAAWLRGRLQPRSRKDRMKWLREDFEDDHYKGVELKSIDYQGIDDSASQAVITSTAHMAESFDPEDFRNFQSWESQLGSEVRWFRTENETHDYSFAGLTFRGETHYRLPETHRLVHEGAQIDFNSEFGSFRRRYRLQDRELVVVTEIDLPRGTIAAERIPSFNRFLDHVGDNARITFDVAVSTGL